MKTALIFAGSSPIHIITSYPPLGNKRFLEKLKQKWIDKFIAFEVQLESAKKKYGSRFDVIKNDLIQLKIYEYSIITDNLLSKDSLLKN